MKNKSQTNTSSKVSTKKDGTSHTNKPGEKGPIKKKVTGQKKKASKSKESKVPGQNGQKRKKKTTKGHDRKDI